MGPSAVEKPMAAPITANALPRVRPANISWISAVTAGKKMPPHRPWTTRATISSVAPSARPHQRLASVNPARPTTNTHLWPTRSPTRPAGMRARP